jgi:predicted SAM-dependent methyltransferase
MNGVVTTALADACLCGDRSVRPRYHVQTRAIVQCLACGLWRTCPRPSPSVLTAAYAEAYPAHEPSAPATHGTGWRRIWVLPALPAGSRVVEFGSASGRFARWAEASRGWRMIEVDGVGAAEDFTPPAGSVDGVVAWHVLEHTLDPCRVLANAFGMLRSGGQLALAVPNVNGLERRWFGAAWRDWSLPFHLWHFSPRTLRGMVTSAGFRVDRVLHQRTFKGLGGGPLVRDALGAVVAAVHASARITLLASKP